MGGIYGISKAAKLNEAGDYAQAIVEATRAIELDREDPEALVERAFACAQLERYAEAVPDLERAFELDESADILDTDMADDAYFSALLGWARQEAATSPDAGVRRIARYAEVRPVGRHGKDVEEWTRRLRGEVRGEYVKRRVDE